MFKTIKTREVTGCTFSVLTRPCSFYLKILGQRPRNLEKQYDLSFKMSPFYNNDNNNHFYPPFPYQNFSKLHAWRILFYIFNEFFNAVAISKRYRFNRKIPIEKKFQIELIMMH